MTVGKETSALPLKNKVLSNQVIHKLAILQANLTVASYHARRQLLWHRNLTESIPQSIQHQILLADWRNGQSNQKMLGNPYQKQRIVFKILPERGKGDSV